MKQELRNYLENTIFQSELSINESWIDTTFRWIQGNKYSLIEDTSFDEMTLKEALSDETFDELYELYLKEKRG